MLVSPDDVRVRGKYEQTPAGMQEFINDQLRGRVWVTGESQVIHVPMYLAVCGGDSAWQEIVQALRHVGWDVYPTIQGFTKDRIHHVDLHVKKVA